VEAEGPHPKLAHPGAVPVRGGAYATELLAGTAGAWGTLLKDRVAEVGEFVAAPWSGRLAADGLGPTS